MKELNAQRLVLEDFPKTFREIKDTELVKQMSEEEIDRVFNGQLSSKDNQKEQDIFYLSDEMGISLEEAEGIINDRSRLSGVSTEDTDNKDNLLDEKSPVQSTLFDYIQQREEVELNEKEESLAEQFAVKQGDTVYFDHEAYIARDIEKNKWGACHLMEIVTSRQ